MKKVVCSQSGVLLNNSEAFIHNDHNNLIFEKEALIYLLNGQLEYNNETGLYYGGLSETSLDDDLTDVETFKLVKVSKDGDIFEL